MTALPILPLIVAIVIILWIGLGAIYEKLSKARVAVLVFSVLIFVGSIIVLASTKNELRGHEIAESTRIFQLQDVVSSEGSFFLGIGSLEGAPAFIYYTESDDKTGYQLRKIAADEVTIRYIEDGSPPRIEQEEISYHFKNILGWEDYHSEKVDGYYIYVPKGSIKEYYLDGPTTEITP